MRALIERVEWFNLIILNNWLLTKSSKLDTKLQARILSQNHPSNSQPDQIEEGRQPIKLELEVEVLYSHHKNSSIDLLQPQIWAPLNRKSNPRYSDKTDLTNKNSLLISPFKHNYIQKWANLCNIQVLTKNYRFRRPVIK